MSPTASGRFAGWRGHTAASGRLPLLVLVTAAGCGLLTGCLTAQGPDGSELPWATQESWEGTPAVPGMGTGGGGQFGGNGL